MIKIAITNDISNQTTSPALMFDWVLNTFLLAVNKK